MQQQVTHNKWLAELISLVLFNRGYHMDSSDQILTMSLHGNPQIDVVDRQNYYECQINPNDRNKLVPVFAAMSNGVCEIFQILPLQVCQISPIFSVAEEVSYIG